MKNILILLLACLTLAACEKVDLSEFKKNKDTNDGTVKVTFKVAGIEQVPFGNTTSRVGDALYTRFSVALFQNDTKVKSVNQTTGDKDFGTIAVDLAPGTYQYVAIAHNGLASCTISFPDKITFASNKMTDTFYYYGKVDITESCTNAIVLKRAVSMFRLIVTDPIPETVTQMKFYYTGGSSTFDATTGFGCVNSKQTEIINVSDARNGVNGKEFEIYTFPHEVSDAMTVKVTAMDENGNTITETSYENVPIQQNVITQYTTTFFTNTPGTISNLSTTATVENNGQWNTTIDL